MDIKLIVVFGVDEHKAELDKLFREAGVPVFSRLEVEGVTLPAKTVPAINWFGTANVPADAFANLTFTTEEQAANLLAAIRTHNDRHPSTNPFRAFQMPVEASA